FHVTGVQTCALPICKETGPQRQPARRPTPVAPAPSARPAPTARPTPPAAPQPTRPWTPRGTPDATALMQMSAARCHDYLRERDEIGRASCRDRVWDP